MNCLVKSCFKVTAHFLPLFTTEIILAVRFFPLLFRIEGRLLLRLPVCFPTHQVPSEKRTTLKRKTLLQQVVSKFFLFRADIFSEGRQEQILTVASLESVSIIKLTHCSLEISKRVIGKQREHRSDATELCLIRVSTVCK